MRRVIVFCPHKVASRSVCQSHKRSVHTHQRQFVVDECKNGDVIFLGVRHPFSLRLSAFFQDMCSRFVKHMTREEVCAASTETLADEFYRVAWRDYGFSSVQLYLDALHREFDCDLLSGWTPSKPFIVRKAVKHRKTGTRVTLCVYKMEQLSQSVFDAMNVAVGLPPAPLVHTNEGSAKWYADPYARLKGHLEPHIPQSELGWYTAMYLTTNKVAQRPRPRLVQTRRRVRI
jgi:hypothetical protein